MAGENIGNTYQQVAVEIKRVREAARLSQEQMAARLGLGYAPGGRKVSTGRATVSLWERGRRTPPPQHLQAYIDLGGNPAILAPQPVPPPQELAETPPACPAAGLEAPAADSAGSTPAAGRQGGISRHWLLTAI